jgi:hypothetical protein
LPHGCCGRPKTAIRSATCPVLQFQNNFIPAQTTTSITMPPACRRPDDNQQQTAASGRSRPRRPQCTISRSTRCDQRRRSNWRQYDDARRGDRQSPAVAITTSTVLGGAAGPIR